MALAGILCTALVVCLAVGTADAEHAIALGLPAGLLLIGGLIIITGQDPAVGERVGYLSGFWTGVLLTRSKSAVRPRRSRRR